MVPSSPILTGLPVQKQKQKQKQNKTKTKTIWIKEYWKIIEKNVYTGYQKKVFYFPN